MALKGQMFTSSEILYFDFNQDSSCLAVGTRTGYKIFNCDPFGKCYEKNDGGMGIVSMLFCTSLVALVGAGEQPSLSPRKLAVMNTKRESVIHELSYSSKILNVKLNKKRLIVVLEECINLYDITNLKLLHTIDTPINTRGLAALSPSSESTAYLACPSQQNIGSVLVFDVVNLQAVNVISAHRSPINNAVFNPEGTLLATSSDKGTVIRVFSIPDGHCKYSFRRGSFPVTITSLSFSQNSAFLTISSASETVHIFKLHSRELVKNHSSSSMFSGYLPEAITDILEPSRDFAHLKLPYKCHSISALNNNLPQVMVATLDGYFYVYAIDLDHGGECTLLKQYNMLEK